MRNRNDLLPVLNSLFDAFETYIKYRRNEIHNDVDNRFLMTLQYINQVYDFFHASHEVKLTGKQLLDCTQPLTAESADPVTGMLHRLTFVPDFISNKHDLQDFLTELKKLEDQLFEQIARGSSLGIPLEKAFKQIRDQLSPTPVFIPGAIQHGIFAVNMVKTGSTSTMQNTLWNKEAEEYFYQANTKDQTKQLIYLHYLDLPIEQLDIIGEKLTEFASQTHNAHADINTHDKFALKEGEPHGLMHEHNPKFATWYMKPEQYALQLNLSKQAFNNLLARGAVAQILAHTTGIVKYVAPQHDNEAHQFSYKYVPAKFNAASKVFETASKIRHEHTPWT